jgi:Xaa-Pro aminopeptidase
VSRPLWPQSPSRTNGSSRSWPTSGSIATSSSRHADCSRRRSRTSSGGGTPAPDRSSDYRRAINVATGIDPDELRERRERLRALVTGHGPSGLVVFDQSYVQYLTRFSFLATERPVAYLERFGGETAAFVPEFEVARVRAETGFDRVESYPEYPGTEHPMRILARLLDDMGITGTIAADQDGYPGILGYQGPSLSEVSGAEVVPVAPALEGLMARKSEAEIELVRESARWCEHAHRLLQQYTRPGVTEAQAGLRAGYEASLAMLEALGPSYDGGLSSTDGASAGYRGQIGARSAWAHAVAHNNEFRPGDVLVSETAAPVWGYNAELERTMIVGPPTDEMRRRFDQMCAAQQVAFTALRPGVTCADVDRAVLAYFEEQAILDTWSQHTGHAIGLRNHEAPFLDVGDETVVEPGMVLTIEPGVYVACLGGFRHSDTVVVRPDGIEILTEYPSDLESLTLPL